MMMGIYLFVYLYSRHRAASYPAVPYTSANDDRTVPVLVQDYPPCQRLMHIGLMQFAGMHHALTHRYLCTVLRPLSPYYGT